MDGELLVESCGRVRVLTLSRPAKRNALDTGLLERLQAELAAGKDNDGVGAFVLTGAPPAFCSGMDRALLAPGDQVFAARVAFLRALRDVLDAMARSPKPIVAAVNGPAVAGGAALVCAADLAVGDAGATLSFPGVRESIVAAVVVPVLIRAVGSRRARDLLLTGRRLEAEECRAWGIFRDVVPDGRCLEKAKSLAAELAAQPAEAMAAAKRYLDSAEEGAIDPTAMHLPGIDQRSKIEDRRSE